MDRLAVPAVSPFASCDSRLGRRCLVERPAGRVTEQLQLHEALAGNENFVRALKKSAVALETFRHSGCIGPPLVFQDSGQVVVTSPWEPGRTLAAVLDACEDGARRLTTSSVLYVLREVIAFVRAQQAHRSRTWHGQITPEHVKVTPELRVIVTDHVFGAAFAALPPAPAAEMWRQWGTAVPANNALPRFGPKTDQLQIGALALALLLGRQLRADEYPARAGALLTEASETNLLGEPIPLGLPLQRWMERALWLTEKGPFPTMGSMDQQLGELLSDELGYVAVPIATDFGVSEADARTGAERGVGDAGADHALAPGIEVPAPGTEALSQRTGVPSPGGDLLSPDTDVLSPGVDVLSPDTDVLSRGIDVLSPDIEVLLAESDVLDAVADWRAVHAVHGGTAATHPIEPPDTPDAFGWDVGESEAMVWGEAESGVFDLATHDPAAPSAMWASDSDVENEFVESANSGSAVDEDLVVESVAPVAEVADACPDAIVSGPDIAADGRGTDAADSMPTYAPWRAVDRASDAPSAPPPAEPTATLAVPACDWLAASLATSAHAETPAEPAGEPVSDASPPPPQEPDSARTPPPEPDVNEPTPISTPLAGRASVHAPTSVGAVRPRAVAPQAPVAMPRTLFGASSLDGEESSDFDENPARTHVLFGGDTAGDASRSLSFRRSVAIAAAVFLVIALAGVAWRWSRPAGPAAEDAATSADEIAAGASNTPLAGTAAPGAPRGGLRITSIPSGVRLVVDGSERGVTPLTVDDLAPGEHAVVVENAVHRVERRVTVGAGETTGLDIPLSGRVVVVSPLPVKVFDRGRLVGESTARRLELAAGRRRIEVVNEVVSYRETFEIDVPAGGTARVSVAPPTGVLHLTADEPVAVRIDGRPVGVTPVGGVTLPLGEHRVAFRHPQFGEQTYTIVVSLNSPNRLHATFVPPRPTLPRQTPRR